MEFGKVQIGTSIRMTISELCSIKVGNLFYRISVVEKESEPYIGLEEDFLFSEEEEENSKIPSEWSKEDASDDEGEVVKVCSTTIRK